MSAELLSFPRTLGHVLAEITRAQADADLATERFYAAEARGDSDDADCQSDVGAAADNRLLDLRTEAVALIEARLGVTWAQLAEANL